MYRHFVTSAQIAQPQLSLGRTDAHHLQSVLRVKKGTEVELFDGKGHVVHCRITHCERNGLTLEHAGPTVEIPAPPCCLTLCACVSKGKRMDWTLEKAVELGVGRIIPILSDRSVVQLESPAEADEKRNRWLRIAIEAARQCGTAWIPELTTPLPFDQALPRIAAIRPLLVAALTPEALPMREALAPFTSPPREAAWVVGPEGDFTTDELEALRRAGGTIVSLGANVLRTETAAIYGLSVLGAAWMVPHMPRRQG
jgi:16S rRNA (uracil1498-N3)-methyltransferase